jgi:hypothetical protein
VNASHHELLERFQPSLRYDSLETYFADSAEEWTASPDNRLVRHDGEPVAVGEGLSLDFLGPSYADGRKAEKADAIESRSEDYSRRYAELREAHQEFRNVIYGRVVPEGDELWLQYWFFYFLNDYQLAWGIDVHEGDWEMVQLRIPTGVEEPDVACYAQHNACELRPWERVRRDGDHPLVFVGRGSHASFFDPGYHPTDFYDITSGERQPQTPVRLMDVTDAPAWLEWPGHWGRTRRTKYPGPGAPCSHPQWSRPSALLETAWEVPLEEPPGAPRLKVKRQRDRRLAIDFDATRCDRPLKRLVVTVNSSDEKRTPPRPFRFALSRVVSGRLVTDIELAREKHYDVRVATVDLGDRPSMAKLFLFEPPNPLLTLRRHVTGAAGWVVYRLRRLLGSS